MQRAAASSKTTRNGEKTWIALLYFRKCDLYNITETSEFEYVLSFRPILSSFFNMQIFLMCNVLNAVFVSPHFSNLYVYHPLTGPDEYMQNDWRWDNLLSVLPRALLNILISLNKLCKQIVMGKPSNQVVPQNSIHLLGTLAHYIYIQYIYR